MRSWSLVITSWRGISAGASHWYGVIEGPANVDESLQRHELRRPTTPEDVNEGYFIGESTQRFNSRDELVAAAIDLWKTENLGGELLCGLPIYDDREVLARDPEA